MPAIFDFDAFSQTAMDVSKIDYEWHSLPDKTESLAQIVKLGGRSMEEYKEKFNNRDVVSIELQWELRNAELAKSMNMDKLIVRQNVLGPGHGPMLAEPLVEDHRVGQQGVVVLEELVHRIGRRLACRKVGHRGAELHLHGAFQEAAAAGGLVHQLDPAAAGKLDHVVVLAVVHDVHRYLHRQPRMTD